MERYCCHCVAPLKQRRCASSRQRQSLQPVATSDTGSDCGSVPVPISVSVSVCVSKLALAVLVSCQTLKFAMTANIASVDVDSSSSRSSRRSRASVASAGCTN